LFAAQKTTKISDLAYEAYCDLRRHGIPAYRPDILLNCGMLEWMKMFSAPAETFCKWQYTGNTEVTQDEFITLFTNMMEAG
jgi:hypothetical protein